MGQSSSANIEHLPASTSVTRSEPPKPRGPPKRPTSPPRPKTPNYVVAQNKVLPGNIPLDGKSNLRPVSQELVKFMPEIADIYQVENDAGLPMDCDGDKENFNETTTTSIKQALEGPIVTPDRDLNITKIRNGTSTPNNSNHSSIDSNSRYSKGESSNNDSGIFEGEFNTNVTRETPRLSNGLSQLRNTSFDHNGRIKGHRRQQSACTSLLNDESTIPEDPREHLYNEWRKDPYSNSLPSGASLPVKSNFDMDESFNLTYAQLAEARRKKTLEQLERRTGKKIQDLTDDLADQSTIMPSPFDRYSSKAIGKVTSISVSRSNSTTSSSDTGVSKRKKKRAPPPPSQNNTNEPPADYDLVRSTSSLPPRTKRQLSDDSSSHAVSLSNHAPSAPPPPLNIRKKGPAPTAGGMSPRKSSTGSERITSVSVSRSSSFKSPPVLPKPARQLSELELRLQVVRDTVEGKIAKGAEEETKTQRETEDQKDETASMSTDTVSTMSDNLSLYSIESRTKSDTASMQTEEVKSQVDPIAETEAPVTKNSEPEKSEVNSKNSESTKQVDGQRKLSSLLKHDIIIAAQARGAKIVKHTTPVISKPKDQQSVFKEQLGKALTDRDDRMRKSMTIDERLGINKQPHGRVIETKSDNKENIVLSLSKMSSSQRVPPPISVKMAKSVGNIINNDSDTSPRRDTKSSNFSEDWTPEHDLGSDEDMTDQFLNSHKPATSDGFKSQIIPNNVNDLKSGSMQRPGKMNRIYNKQSESVNDEKNKYGSIRKLKKTVHKGVKSAFGSLSRASGKILRRQRNQDEDQQDDNSSNWRLSTSSLNHKYPPDNGLDHSESEESDFGGMGIEDIRFDIPDSPTSPEDVKQMKRAGVAYVSGHGQLVVLPDFPSAMNPTSHDVEEDEGRAPKIYRKKKKKISYESTVRKQERQQWEDHIADQIKVKELEIERERTKQMEMELEYRRLRDLDSQEKLQRLQTEHIQHQINSMQHPNHLSAHTGTGSIHNYDPSPFNSLITSNVPQSPPIMATNFTPNNSHMISNVSRNFTSSDVNQLSEYMKLMGVPPPSTPQQWAYLLNSVNFGPSPLQHSQSMYLPTTAPDLSRIFTKPIDNMQIHQKQTMMDAMPVGQSTTSKLGVQNGQMSFEKRRMIDVLSNGKTAEVVIDNASIGTLLTDFHNGKSVSKSKKGDKTDNTKERSNPVYYSSDEDVEDQMSPAKTNQGIAKVLVSDHREIPVPGMVAPDGGSQIVYDSIGFKTVIFNPSTPPLGRRDMDDSSSGADR